MYVCTVSLAVFNAQNWKKILPSFGTWVLRSTMTMNQPLRMFLVATHPLSMGGHSWKGRSGGGTASITMQCFKARCTMNQHLHMIGPPTAIPSWKSSSTASPVISLRLPSLRQQTTCCLWWMRCGQPTGSCCSTLGWYCWCPATTWNCPTNSGDRWQGRTMFLRTRRTTSRRSPSTSTCRCGIIWQSYQLCGLPPNHRHCFETSFGRFGNWSRRGTSTCSLSSLQRGLYASMSQCLSGTTNGLAPGGCFVHANHGHLVMNTIHHVVNCRALCLWWRWLRGTTILLRSQSEV